MFEIIPTCVPCSCFGRVETGGQAASHRREQGEKEEGWDCEDTAKQAWTNKHWVGADSCSHWSSPPHQRPGLTLETETQVLGKGECMHTCVWFSFQERFGDVVVTFFPKFLLMLNTFERMPRWTMSELFLTITFDLNFIVERLNLRSLQGLLQINSIN